jgi:hypothetical protein
MKQYYGKKEVYILIFIKVYMTEIAIFYVYRLLVI